MVEPRHKPEEAEEDMDTLDTDHPTPNDLLVAAQNFFSSNNISIAFLPINSGFRITVKMNERAGATSRKKRDKKTDDMSPKEKQALAAERPIVWNKRRVAIVKALRSLGATGSFEAKHAIDIVKQAGIETISSYNNLDDAMAKCKVCLNAYLGTELVYHGFAATIRHEGEKQLSYYLTSLGRKVDLPE